MKLQDQVCTLEQAKRLKELGILRGCTHYYYEEIVNGRTSFPVKPLMVISDSCDNELNEELVEALDGITTNEIYPALTVAELGEMLPNCFDTMRVVSDGGGLEWKGYDKAGKSYPSDVGCRTEAEMRAVILIHLLESNSLTAEEANKRLVK